MSINAPSNPVERKKILDALREISDSLTRIAAERDLIKEIINTVSEEQQLDKKIFRKMSKVFHKDSFSEEVAESSEFEVLYENIVQVTTPPSQED